MVNPSSDSSAHLARKHAHQPLMQAIGLIVAGDVMYNQCRIYVGDTTR